MSTETMSNNESLNNEEIHSSAILTEQTENSTSNGAFHNDGNNIMTEQKEPIKESHENSQQEKYNKNDLEPESLRKVFIGGLSYKTDDQAFREYFSQYGDIVVRFKLGLAS